MTARRKARKRALDILFESDLRGTDALETAAVRIAAAEPPVPEYTVTLVEGVQAQRLRIDELIATYSEGWSLARLPGVDRALLRLAIYELLWTDVPAAVVVDEAVELAKSLSTADSPRFVNGLLGRIALLGPSLRA
ncbi:MAG: transcription antitermination factor NusB [Geodermatophilaceae bacterium]|nr:transcription antitermination factor NusB [Geodermatophilaceae bacterium]MDQ3465390.1 transcription antitermination factor NusB [Actinomycetota bacterium]